MSPTESGQCRPAGTVSVVTPARRHQTLVQPGPFSPDWPPHLTTTNLPCTHTPHHTTPHHTASLSLWSGCGVVCLVCCHRPVSQHSSPGVTRQPLVLCLTSSQYNFRERKNWILSFNQACCRTSQLCRCSLSLSLSLSVSLCERERDGDQHWLYAVNEKYCQAAGPETTRPAVKTFRINSIDGQLSCDFCLGFYFEISDNITLAVIGKT